MREDEVRGIGDILGEVLEEDGLQGLSRLLRIKEAWPRIVGEERAEKSKPYRLEGERLHIGVDSHARVQDMHYETEEIKARIKEDLGMEIEEIRVKKINLK